MNPTFELLHDQWLIDRRNKVLVRPGRLDLDCGPGRAERTLQLTYFPTMDDYVFYREWTESERSNRQRLGLAVDCGLFLSPDQSERARDLIGMGSIVVEEIWLPGRLTLTVVNSCLSPKISGKLEFKHPNFADSEELVHYARRAVNEWYQMFLEKGPDRPPEFRFVLQ